MRSSPAARTSSPTISASPTPPSRSRSAVIARWRTGAEKNLIRADTQDVEACCALSHNMTQIARRYGRREAPPRLRASARIPPPGQGARPAGAGSIEKGLALADEAPGLSASPDLLSA